MRGMTDKEWEKVNEFVGKVCLFVEIAGYILLLAAFAYAIFLLSELP